MTKLRPVAKNGPIDKRGAARIGARIGAFSRRLGAQAAMSAIVMTGLHVAASHGLDPRQWLAPDEPAIAAPSSEAPRVVGIPRRFDLPVQAGGAIEQLTRSASGEGLGAAAPAPAERPQAPRAERKPAERAAHPAKLAVPTPRPVEPKTVSVALAEDPHELPFDVSMRVEARPVELAAIYDDVPAPPEDADRFTLGSLVPSGSAILHGAGHLTGTAAGVVSGAAFRVIDLVR